MKVLIVDDNHDDRQLLRYMVERNRCEAIEAEDGLDGLRTAKSVRPDLIISDALMPVMDGFQFLRSIKQEPELRAIPFVFYSASYREDQDVRLAISLGADAYLIKPMELGELWEKIKPNLENRKPESPLPPGLAEEDNEYLRRYCEVVATKLEEKVWELEKTLAERKRAEDALRVSEERYRTIFQNSPLGIFRSTVEGRFVEANPALAKMFGHDSPEALMAENPDVGDRILAQTEDNREPLSGQSGKSDATRQQNRFRRKDGSEFIANLYLKPVRDAEGRPIFLEGILEDVTELKRAEQERLDHLKFFENLDQINRAIQGSNNLNRMMSGVLDVVLAIFACDRAFLMYPCDPDAEWWQAPMERFNPEYPGVLASGHVMPMDAEVAQTLRILLATDGPVQFGPGTGRPLPADVSKRFDFRSFMSMTLYPKLGKPWQFGIHQCSSARIWTSEQERLFREIGRRLSDALSSLLANRDLRESEDRYRRITEGLTDYQYSVRIEKGRPVETRQSPACATVTGFTAEEFTADPYLWINMVAPEDRELVKERVAQILAGKDIPPLEHRIIRKNGEMRWVSDTTILLKDSSGRLLSYDGVIKDITERKLAEARLVASLHEKEMLLKEIHHRVKNNLQVVCSLLSMQSENVSSREAQNFFHETESRVRSMALVHEKLYSSGDLSGIDFGDYVDGLCLYIMSEFKKEGIQYSVNSEQVMLGIDVAVPCGLIATELITNAFKHAFQGRKEGRILITIKRRDARTVEFSVHDDGIGFLPNENFRTMSSMGMTLITSLTEQISGTVSMRSDNGTTFTVAFPA